MKRLNKILVAFVGLLTLTGCQYIGGNVSKIVLSEEEITLAQGETHQLSFTTYPVTADPVDVKWTITEGNTLKSVKDGLVTVRDNLNITSLAKNVVKVTSTKFSNVFDTCTIYVRPNIIVPLESISFEKTVNDISLNHSITLDVNYYPSTASDKRVNYEISDTTIASVENNNNSAVIQGLKVGTTTLKATSVDGGFVASTTINVKEVKATSISLNKTSLILYKDTTETLSATISPADVSDNTIIWSSSNTTVATVNNGVISGKKVGTTVIKATTIDGTVSASCNVEVKDFEGTPKTKLQSTYADYSDNNVYELDHCPSTGDSKLLIIPVWFTDSSSYIVSKYKNLVLEDIKKAYLGTPEETGWHSVKSYYAEESQNTLNLNGVVTDWYECGQSVSYFASSYASAGKSGADRTSDLVKTATDWYFNQSGSDSRQSFDTDGNGYLDGVMLIYGAPDYSACNYSFASSDNLWAYCFWLQNDGFKSTSKPGPNVFFWASYDFMYGQTTVASRTGTSKYHSGDTRYCSVDAHTYIHEMGHVFGLDDYYDYNSGATNPAGGFNMQDNNVGGHDPYSIMALGWADPYIPTTDDTITLRPFESSHDLILLSPEFNEYLSPFDEYLLLEFYTGTGLNEFDTKYKYCNTSPSGVSQMGIRLWHVDARLIYPYGNKWSATNITTNPNHSLGVTHMMSNTSWSEDAADYCSKLGQSYAKYNLLQLIRKNRFVSFTTTKDFNASDLFVNGDEFDPNLYTSQFQNSTKLNNGKYLSWKFSVKINSGTNPTAVITCTKTN